MPVYPLFIDTNTLASFALTKRLDLLRRCVEGHQPHWTEAVHDEVTAGSNRIETLFMEDVLQLTWIGEYWSPSLTDQTELQHLIVALNGGYTGTSHHGEAESILAAMKLNGRFVTDDREAYEFAKLKGLVCYDSVAILQEGISLGSTTADEAWAAVESMLDAGRKISVGPDPKRSDFLL